MELIPLQAVASKQLTAAAATYVTAPPGTKYIIQNATLCNSTAGAVICTVYLIPQGGAPGVSNTIISNRTVNIDETYKCIELAGKVLEAGGYLSAKGLNVVFDVSALQAIT